jgi:Flp pilus assembly protein TadD
VSWAQTLPAKLATRSPVLIPVAESMRRANDWSALENWIAAGEWTVDLELIRLAYAFEASRNLRLGSRQSEIWRTLQSAAVTNGVRAYFTANLLYAWGRTDEGLELLWIAAEQTGVAIEALGTLARHYQVQNDAEGQYRVFRQLHSIRPSDRDLANNYAFFAALLGLDHNPVRQLAEENVAASPKNAVYRATAAFVLLTQERSRESLALLAPISATWRQSPAVAFAYGLALAAQGQKTEARSILTSVDPKTLTRHEVELIKRSLD